MKKALAVSVVIVFGLVSFVTIAGSRPESRTAFGRHNVDVFFTRDASLDGSCTRTRGHERRTIGEDVLHDSMNWLLRGPRAGEKKRGAASMFSSRTAGMVNSVRIKDGTARIDFDDFRKKIPGASSSCGSASLLAELNRTAKQFSSVDRAVYSFEGSKKAFYNWLQMEPPA